MLARIERAMPRSLHRRAMEAAEALEAAAAAEKTTAEEEEERLAPRSSTMNRRASRLDDRRLAMLVCGAAGELVDWCS